MIVIRPRSNSLYRSAAALAALINLSTAWSLYTLFYESIAAVEPIFRLEDLSSNLRDSHPEKKYFLSLIRLARAQVHYRVYQSDITDSLVAFNLQQRRSLLAILESQQYVSLSSIDRCYIETVTDLNYSDPLDIITNSCSLFAKCFAYISFHFTGCGVIAELEEVVETAYLLFVTFAHSFIALHHQTIYLEPSTLRLRSLVLSTYVRWLDDLTHPYLYRQHGGLKCDLNLVQQICKLRGAQLV